MEEKYNVLLCEDDEGLGLMMRGFLQLNKYNVTVAKDGRAGYELAKKGHFDLAILDVMMPHMDGFELATKLKKDGGGQSKMPIIFLSAKNQKEDIMKGYQSGATDYITKPFDSELLLHKIEALVSRWKAAQQQENTKNAESEKPKAYIFDKYKFVPHLRELHADGRVRYLTPKEALLLDQFCQNESKLVHRENILLGIWGENTFFSNRSMNVFLVKVRRYFKGNTHITIKNLYNAGYKFSVKGGVKVVAFSK